jgi:ABC-type phosphate transport system ATPase subunit
MEQRDALSVDPASAPDRRSVAVLETRELNVYAGARQLLRGINLQIALRQVFGIIGPSGAGKSTILRCLNRMLDLTPSLRVEGEVLFRGDSIRALASECCFSSRWFSQKAFTKTSSLA